VNDHATQLQATATTAAECRAAFLRLEPAPMPDRKKGLLKVAKVDTVDRRLQGFAESPIKISESSKSAK
jgi:hypothetical protein